jgi:hypothetical protein
MIKASIIDDEMHCLKTLRMLLKSIFQMQECLKKSCRTIIGNPIPKVELDKNPYLVQNPGY